MTPAKSLLLSFLCVASALAEPELIVYWPLDEASNGSTPDALGRYPLELVNLSGSDLEAGRRGQAFAFVGSDETLLARTHEADDDLPINQHGEFSVSLWVKGDGQGQDDLRVFSEGSSESGTPLFNIGTEVGGNGSSVDIFIRPGSNHLLSDSPAFDNDWHHVAWVQEGDGARLYIDGEEDGASFDAAEGLDVDITSIGGIRRSSGDSHWFTGLIDDVSMWKGVLDETMVASLADGESPSVVAGIDDGGGGGGNPDPPFTPEGEALVITEFLASNNDQLVDANGEYSDWIELWNPRGEAIPLKGYGLTDTEGEIIWTFPEISLAPGAFLLVRASGVSEMVGDEVHASFKISRSAGSYLALVAPDGLTLLSEFKNYEAQRSDVSYGVDNTDKLGFFKRPTPNAKNGSSIAGFVADTQFSVDRGFYEDAFDLEITTATDAATILYTLDGSAPERGSIFTPDHGTVYNEPVRIETTATVRALAYKGGSEPTNIDTHTYLFIDDIAKQPADPEGWPSDWGRDGEVGGIIPSDYEMDPRVIAGTIPDYGIREALLDIPTLSIAMDPEDFVGSNGIYTNPNPSNRAAYERACSLELIYPDGEKGFQENCGVEIHGNSSRRPFRMQKHSMRVSFKSKYGVSRLRFPFFKDSPIENYNKIVLRACFTDSWGLASWGPGRYRPNDSQYIRDMWMKHSMRDMGHDFTNGNFMHLYVNGLYWGLFNPAEKMEAETLVTHLGGTEDDYDINDDFDTAPIDGTSASWNEMHSLSRRDLKVEENYLALREMLDLENFADYMLLHFFGDAEDWPHHNGHAMRNRGAGEPFKFYVWDQEIVLDNFRVARYSSRDSGRPGGLFQELRDSKEFRLVFADRVQKHLFNGGALSVKPSQDRYMALANQIDKAIVAESARWGDTQMSTPYGNRIDQPRDPNDVDDLAYPPAPHGPDFYFTREDSWVIERDNVVNHYIPKIHDRSHSNALLNELEGEELWPPEPAPGFNQHGGIVAEGFRLKLIPSEEAKDSDVYYYTLDGTDPRNFGDKVSSSANTFTPEGDGVELTESVTVKARIQRKGNIFLPDGDWSPMIEATFRVGSFVGPEALRVSEVMYNPASPSEAERAAGFESRSDFEYLELLNTGEGKVILEGLQFAKGISYHFAEGASAELAPGDYVLLVNNPPAMAMRYGNALPIIGTFERGSQLANNGERLALEDAQGNEIWQFSYNDSEGWPQDADGAGRSLVNGGAGSDANLNEPGSWVASSQIGGSPGVAEGGEPPVAGGYADWRKATFPEATRADDAVSGPLADPDRDRLANLFEYAFGIEPLTSSSSLVSVARTSTHLEIRYPRHQGVSDIVLEPEAGSDLSEWTSEGFTISKEGEDMVAARPLVDGASTGEYVRLRVSLKP